MLPAKEAFKIFSTNPDNYGSFFMAAFAQALIQHQQQHHPLQC